MRIHRLTRKAIMVVVLGIGAQLSAKPATAAAVRREFCGWCADSCWTATFACIIGCGSGGNGCYAGCTSVDGIPYPVGLTCS
jgi:hypothetical protein